MARTPIWKSIADTLTHEIGSRHYSPGDKLPTEAQLATRFGVNRHTVRNALANMAEDGLVFARRGAGVFVRQSPTDYPIGKRVRFHKNLSAAGRIPGRHSLRLETRASSDREAKMLNIPTGAGVHVYEGLSLADQHPVALFRSLFPADRLPDLPAALAKDSSVTRSLQECGISDYTRASTRVRAEPATATQALHLQITEGAPLLRTDAINIDNTGQPIELGRTWFAGDRVTLTIGD